MMLGCESLAFYLFLPDRRRKSMDNKLAKTSPIKNRTDRDLLIISVFAITVFALIAYFDVSGILQNLLQKREQNLVDEFSLTAIALVAALCIFSLRRWIESHQIITKLKQVDEKLRQSESLLAEAQRMAQVGSWNWDLRSNTLTWSDEQYRIFGLNPQEFDVIYEAVVREYIHPEDRDLVRHNIENSLMTLESFNFYYRVIHPDGRVRIIHSRGNVVTDEEGNPLRMLGTTQDVTERKRLELDLIETRDAALESTKLKSEFLANMSHEIRTPMNGVIGMTGLLLDTKLNDDQRELAETVLTSGESLLTIINDILDFSKIEAGKLEFETLDFDLKNAVEGTVELLAQGAHEKKLEFTSLFDNEVPTALRGDPGRLGQVLTNLIGNAIKFTEGGEVIVRTAKESETAESVVIRFTVRDTGIGMSEAVQQKLFQPFMQADGSLTRKYGGTGLGLAISKQLVDLLEGEIGVTSKPGQGSTFWFTARFGKQPESPTISQPAFLSTDKLQVLSPESSTSRRKPGIQILLAEDNIINQKVVVRQLQKLGYRADAVANGREALEALGRIPYDLVLMDCQMPEMDGYEATAEIRRREGITRHTPIVAITANALKGDREKCIASGMDDYITKPVNRKILEEVLERILLDASQRRMTTRATFQEALPPVDLKRLHQVLGDHRPITIQATTT
jgi:PAS domain S-box-containing protein